MLLDLTKELMHELGITLVGDVIAILKHAKVAYRQVSAHTAPNDPKLPQNGQNLPQMTPHCPKIASNCPKTAKSCPK